MSNFNNNSGCAIYTSSNVVITFKGTSNFINNSAQFEDGVIHAETNTSIRFIGISDFTHNSAVSGGAIYATDNIVLTFNGTTNFFNNQQQPLVVVQLMRKFTYHWASLVLVLSLITGQNLEVQLT